MRTLAAALLPLALLCACQRKPATPLVAPIDMKAPPAPVEPYGFDIALSLSPAAKAKLERIHEKIEAGAYYYGMPNAEGKKHADEEGQIDLGSDKPQADPDATTIHVSGASFDTAKLSELDGDPLVLVNVYTARKAAKDNLLDCGIFEDTVRKAKVAPVNIACKLIYPDPKQGGAQ